MMKRFWIRWLEPWDEKCDSRPLSLPLSDAVLGWWESGYAADLSFATCCAHVEAESPEAAADLIRAHWKPREFSFCHEKPKDWLPGDRFPETQQP